MQRAEKQHYSCITPASTGRPTVVDVLWLEPHAWLLLSHKTPLHAAGEDKQQQALARK